MFKLPTPTDIYNGRAVRVNGAFVHLSAVGRYDDWDTTAPPPNAAIAVGCGLCMAGVPDGVYFASAEGLWHLYQQDDGQWVVQRPDAREWASAYGDFFGPRRSPAAQESLTYAPPRPQTP